MKCNSISEFKSHNEMKLFEMNGAKLTMFECSFADNGITKLWISTTIYLIECDKNSETFQMNTLHSDIITVFHDDNFK